MLIQHRQTGTKGSFYVVNGEDTVAEMTYTMPAANKLIIDHTEVDPSLSGKGVGLQLLHTAVEFARTNSFKIIPLCPFAKSVFEKKKEYGDVLN